MKKDQRGSVLLITLWTITLLTILVTVIASQNRLSARAAFYHQEELGAWAAVLAAVNQAEMELMMERMPRPPETIEDTSEINRNPAFRYNGRALQLNYPQAEGITVRIYDHAGKINLREINRPRMRALLEKRVGDDDPERIDALMAAWNDWLDLNDGVSINGAERDYYESLDVPYTPRNGRLETVDELLSIRGFDEVFAGVDLEAAFTLYSGNQAVNLNLATVEAMQLLPGLDDELIERIVAFRETADFRGNGDVAQLVPVENMAELRLWINNLPTSDVYTIIAYPTRLGMVGEEGEEVEADISTNGYAEIVQIRSYNDKPKVLKVNPYEKIPQRLIVRTED